jgi:glycosyltransferase involved in cell wall biosynthesis
MLPVTESVAGGAEQMLWTLEQQMASRGHRTTVAACKGSRVAGRLVATGSPPVALDALDARNTEHEAAVLAEIRRARDAGEPYDLIHDKGGSFWRRAAEVDVSVLATLHLPRPFYPQPAFERVPPNLSFNCVSQSQLQDFHNVPAVLGAVANGIRVEKFSAATVRKKDYLLWLGRICLEKGAHVAIEVARAVGMPLVIAGDVYRFSYHQQYYEREIAPRIDGKNVRFVCAPSFEHKVELLRHARALLVPSLVDETSSLVSKEAAACGTPVVAFWRGALPEVVRDGITGFVVHSTEQMVEAVRRIDEIDPQVCRTHAEREFTAVRMAGDYEQVYARALQVASQTVAGAA